MPWPPPVRSPLRGWVAALGMLGVLSGCGRVGYDRVAVADGPPSDRRGSAWRSARGAGVRFWAGARPRPSGRGVPRCGGARANRSHTEVECSCVGLKAGQPYTTRQLLEALLMVSGNDAANMLADMLGGQRVAVAAMNRKAASVGARGTRASSPSGLDGPGWESITTPHDLAVILRAALTYPLIAQIMRQSVGTVPWQDHRQPERAADALPRHDRRQDRVHQPRCATRSSPPPSAGTVGSWWCRCTAPATYTAKRSAYWTGASASTADARWREHSFRTRGRAG